MVTAIPVAVTGAAWHTALGDDLEDVWQALLEGRSGLRTVPFPGRLRNMLAAPATDVSRPPEARLIEMAAATLSRALEAAGRTPSDPGVQLVIATSLGAYLDDATSRASLSAWGDAVAATVGAVTKPIVISTACSSGADAIMVATELVRSGASGCCVAGGVDVLTPSKRLAHTALGTMSPTRLRPFDIRHDGTLLGEGSAFLVIEPITSNRQAVAKLLGAASANDATGMAGADVTGLSAAYALKRSFLDAGLAPSEVGLVNAHGSGTLMNDTTECQAFNRVFTASDRPIVFATKPNFGHTLGATGAIEAIAVIMALRTGTVPPIGGLEQPIPELMLRMPVGARIDSDARVGVSLTLGFGGFDTSLVFGTAS